jgi:hypothetical protein
MATKKYKTFTPVVTTAANLSSVPNTDGQLVVVKDGGGVYYDNGTDRTLVSLEATGTAAGASKIYKVYSTYGGSTSGTTYYPLSAITTGTGLTNVYAQGSAKFYMLGNSSGTGYSQLILGNSLSTTSKRIGEIKLYGSSSGTTTISPLNDSTSSNTVILPSTTGILLTQEKAASTYLPLTGGTTTGSIIAGTSTTSTECDSGVNSSAGKLILYSNPSTSKRGLWDENASTDIIALDSSNNISFKGQYLDLGNSSNSSSAYLQVISSVGTISLWSDPSESKRGLYDNKMGAYLLSTYAGTDSNPVGKLLLRNSGECSIYATGNDQAGSMWGGSLSNLVISSWYGISFTTSCSGQTYTGKAAVEINCRTGLLSAASIRTSTIYPNSQTTYKCPCCYYGTSTPSSSTGTNGDIYVVYSS